MNWHTETVATDALERLLAVIRATPESIFWAPRTSSRVTDRKESAVL